MTNQGDLKACATTYVVPCLLNITFLLRHQVQPLCSNADRVRRQIQTIGFPAPGAAPTPAQARLIVEAQAIIDHARVFHLDGVDPCGAAGGSSPPSGGGHGGWGGHGWPGPWGWGSWGGGHGGGGGHGWW